MNCPLFEIGRDVKHRVVYIKDVKNILHKLNPIHVNITLDGNIISLCAIFNFWCSKSSQTTLQYTTTVDK